MTTRAKLELWLAANSKPSRPPAVGSVVRLVQELTADLSPQQVAAFTHDIAALLENAYGERRLAAPRWVRDLARRSPRTARKDSESVA